MNQRIFRPGVRPDFSSPEGRRKVFAAVQAFIVRQQAELAAGAKLREQLQAFGNAADFPASVLPILEKFRQNPIYDTGYEDVFDIKDMTQSERSGFKILDVEHGLSFSEVPVGGKATIYKMGGSVAEVDFVLYGGGLGWLRTLIEDREYWTLEDNAIAFVNRAAYDKAAAFYALIEALGAGYNVAWQSPDPSTLANTNETYTANRDAQTLNAAALAILKAVKDKGYSINPRSVQFVVVTPFDLVGRLTKALGLLLQGFGGSPRQVAFSFRLIPTLMFSTLTSYYVALPKEKAKGGTRKNLEVLSKFDIETYSDIAVGWQRFGGAIGDSDQFRRCAIS